MFRKIAGLHPGPLRPLLAERLTSENESESQMTARGLAVAAAATQLIVFADLCKTDKNPISPCRSVLRVL